MYSIYSNIQLQNYIFALSWSGYKKGTTALHSLWSILVWSSFILFFLLLLFNALKPAEVFICIFSNSIVYWLNFSWRCGKVWQRGVSKYLIFVVRCPNTNLGARGFPQVCILRDFPFLTAMRFYGLWISMHCRNKNLECHINERNNEIQR